MPFKKKNKNQQRPQEQKPIPAQPEAPGSDQFYEEIGTSTVGGFGLLIRSTTGIPIPSPVELENSTKVSRTESLTGTVGTRFPTATTASSAAGGDGSGGGEERRGREKIIS
ncbi:hypothetical protein F511_30449 [Dorcoceras hygrometricum]|uniref:Uncharacterized protein n=1 Tax=Dorcoceras hygrometricum TaxID=472368 RepID=A0A2Z7BXR0_9LAMI|nr:hypothetical protein F511_30449 [Dorcoceras hygrometricum]